MVWGDRGAFFASLFGLTDSTITAGGTMDGRRKGGLMEDRRGNTGDMEADLSFRKFNVIKS